MQRLGLGDPESLELAPRLWRSYNVTWSRTTGCVPEHRQLGSGRFGTVALFTTRPTETMPAQRVAVKTLPAIEDPKRRRSRDKELASVTYAAHMYRRTEQSGGWTPFVAATLDAVYPLGASDPYGSVQIVMEYVPGMSLLEARRTNGVLQASIVHNVISDLLEAVAFLHRLEMVHRDIKPCNVILTNADDRWRGPNRAVLIDMDFSCVFLTKNSFEATACDRYMGSPFYMSPAMQAVAIKEYKSFFSGWVKNNLISLLQSNDVWAIGVTVLDLYADVHLEPADVVLRTKAPYKPALYTEGTTPSNQVEAINTLIAMLFALEPFEEALIGRVAIDTLAKDALFTQRNAERISELTPPYEVLDKNARPHYPPYVCGGDRA